MPISQNGFPVLVPTSKKLHQWRFPTADNIDVVFSLREGSAGFNLAFFASIFDDRVEDVDGMRDDWGYAYRPIRGYDEVWSNHASGTAIDLNATQHPLGKPGTFSDAEVLRVHTLLRRRFMANGAPIPVIRWGGDYRNRKDEMHFECALSLPYQEQVARRLAKSPRGKMLLEANPGQLKVINS